MPSLSSFCKIFSKAYLRQLGTHPLHPRLAGIRGEGTGGGRWGCPPQPLWGLDVEDTFPAEFGHFVVSTSTPFLLTSKPI